jgi:hypothetical protein
MILATAKASKLVAVCATVVLKNCSDLWSPPKKKHIPRTNSRLDNILPIKDVWTMTILRCVKAMIATIGSTAFLDSYEYIPTQFCT